MKHKINLAILFIFICIDFANAKSSIQERLNVNVNAAISNKNQNKEIIVVDYFTAYVPLGGKANYYYSDTGTLSSNDRKDYTASIISGDLNNVIVVQNNCKNISLFDAIDRCDVHYKYTPTGIGNEVVNHQFTMVNKQIIGYPEYDLNYDWTKTVTFKTYSPNPENESCISGSILMVDSKTVAETIPIIGSEFSIFYSTAFANSYSGNTLNSNPYFNSDGLTISSHHYYDSSQNSLFLGTGSLVGVSSQIIGSGNRRVISRNGDEIYIFNSSGKHLETT